MMMHRGMNHIEGGWPKDIDANSVEQMSAYRRKIEREEGFVTELRRTSKDLSKVLSQNITLDIYSKGFSDYTGDYTSEIPRVQLVTSIRFVVLFPLHSPF